MLCKLWPVIGIQTLDLPHTTLEFVIKTFVDAFQESRRYDSGLI